MRIEMIILRVKRMLISTVITLVLFLILACVGNPKERGEEETARMAEHYYDIGVDFLWDYKLGEAMENFNKAIRLKPEVYYYEVGKKLWTAEKHDEAIVSFEEAIRFNPQVPDYYLELANCLLFLRPGQSQRHLELIEKALSLDPDNPRAISARARIYVNKGEYDKAVPLSQRASELDPDNPDNYISLGWSYFMLKQFKNSITAMEKVMDLNPTDYQLAVAHWRIGVGYLNLGDREEALRRYDILKTIKGGNSYAEFLLRNIERKTYNSPPQP